MAYSINASSDHCYEGTTCLINKLNIHNEEKLAEVEAAIVLGKVTRLDQNPISTNFFSVIFMTGLARFGRLISPRKERFSPRLTKYSLVRTLVSSGYRVFVPTA